jgi:hypothetical protein
MDGSWLQPDAGTLQGTTVSQPALIVRSFWVVVDKLGQTLAFWLVMKVEQVDKCASTQVCKYSSIH